MTRTSTRWWGSSTAKKTLELDKYQGSYTDLGALYVQAGRYDEAESRLRHAVERDWYDTAAHVELGCLNLLRGDDHLPDASHEFRQALVTDPASVRASVGLAEALSRAGKAAEAETALRKALNQDMRGDEWQLHDELARLLLLRGTRQQDPALLDDAYGEAQLAIGAGPGEAEPYFTAGLVQFSRASHTRPPLERRWFISRARKHFDACLALDKQNIDALRYRDVLKREMRWIKPGSLGGVALASLSLALLVFIWCVFLLTKKVSAELLSVNIPVLVGLFTVAMVLPALTRLKMPGFEADLQPQSGQEPRGPTGEDSFGPGRLTVPIGPTGQIPRRGQTRLQTTKSTKPRTVSVGAPLRPQGAQRAGQLTVVDNRQPVRRPGNRHVEVVTAVLRLAEDAGRVGDDHPVEFKALGLGHGEQGGRRVERLRAVTGDRRRDRGAQGRDQGVGSDHGQAAAVGAAKLGQVRGGPGGHAVRQAAGRDLHRRRAFTLGADRFRRALIR
jgi:tetratricopeptide (TPR) repeat protein